MFDTTTAFYHTNGGQPARGLFSNINLSSSLSSQLLQNSLVMFPLSGLFTQQENNEVTSTHSTSATTTTTTTTTTTVSTITAPTPPPCSPISNSNNNHTNNNNSNNSSNSNNNNKRSSRRIKNQNSTSTQATNTNQQQIVALSSAPKTSTGNHISPRRKKLSNRMNRKLIDDAITFSAIAVEEDQRGNHQCALDLYLNALENMLYAMPIHSDARRREAVAEKLHEFVERVGLADEFAQPIPQHNLACSSPSQQTNTPTSDCTSPAPRDGISNHIIKAAVNSAVALKQSPIPDAISATVNYTMKKVKQIDETYGLHEKAWEISRTGINLALEIDQQYNVHEKVGNAIFLTVAAAMKAGIAYKDSPSYQELKRMQAEYRS